MKQQINSNGGRRYDENIVSHSTCVGSINNHKCAPSQHRAARSGKKKKNSSSGNGDRHGENQHHQRLKAANRPHRLEAAKAGDNQKAAVIVMHKKTVSG